jgi:hypothetical protein
MEHPLAVRAFNATITLVDLIKKGNAILFYYVSVNNNSSLV